MSLRLLKKLHLVKGGTLLDI